MSVPRMSPERHTGKELLAPSVRNAVILLPPPQTVVRLEFLRGRHECKFGLIGLDRAFCLIWLSAHGQPVDAVSFGRVVSAQFIAGGRR